MKLLSYCRMGETSFGIGKKDGVIDNLLQSFGKYVLDIENHFNPNEDDISDWFGGAPGWLRRS